MKKGMFKKIFATFLVTLGALGLVSCGGEEKPSTIDPIETAKPTEKPSETVKPTEKPNEDKYDCITIPQAIAKAKENGDERYYVRGIIKEISNADYGEMTITDGTNSLYVYGTYSADGEKRYPELEDKPVTGDEVVLYTKLGTYNDKVEAKSAWIVDFTHIKQEVDPSKYEKMTINEARLAEADKLLMVTGVVAKITYANGMKPNGFMLIDDTASIYVYGSIANEVEAGNTITIAATKAYYNNPKEIEAANKLGYKGSNQLTNAIVIENDKLNSSFSTAAVEEASVKDVLLKPINEDHTAKVYKSEAIIVKAPGDGFTNYYINDLDGATGSYVYSQCNGNDFSWLDEFDGKVCEVIYTPLNAKCVSGGHSYRFVPISVKAIDNYEFDKTKACEFISEYYLMDQFQSSYRHNPDLKVLTSIKNDFINISATVSYSSSDESIVKFVDTADGTIMTTLNAGDATITMKITAEGRTIDVTKAINVADVVHYDSVNVKAAIDAADGTELIVKGIVGPSLVNKDGFYLMDETGAIAIQTTRAAVNELQLGDMVILKGKKDHKVKDENVGSIAGQANLRECEILDNYYGDNPLPENIVVKDKTIADLNEMKGNVNVDYSTTIFRVEVKVIVIKGKYSTNYIIEDPADKNISIMAYNANASQLAWLTKYENKTVTMDLALCNWNDKSDYKFCPLSVSFEGNIEYNLYNLKK